MLLWTAIVQQAFMTDYVSQGMCSEIGCVMEMEEENEDKGFAESIIIITKKYWL